MIYTFNPENRTKAIELAAKIATEGQEATVHCGTSRFGASQYMDFVEERNGETYTRHYFTQEIRDGKWVFAGVKEAN